MSLSRLKFLDNDLWLRAKLRVTTACDRLDFGRTHGAEPEMFAQVRFFCTFLGHPRSGHSVVSSILDAHPDAIFSHRLDALRYILQGCPAEEVFHMIKRNSERFARGGRRLTGYAYPIPGQFQGRSRVISAIGDQEAKWATLRLDRDPGLLERFSQSSGIDLRFIHVVRNPFDNITTMANRRHLGLASAIETYFTLCRGVETVTRRYGQKAVLVVRHEELIAEPVVRVAALCDFLGLEPTRDYLESCQLLLYPASNHSRLTRTWTPDLIREVMERAARFDFLAGYRYETGVP